MTALQLLSDSEVDSYQPTESQRHAVIARYGSCNFPGCTMAASKCQMDHAKEYNRGGPTATWNLQPLCTKHHRLKTLGEYTVELDPQGNAIWRSKDGEEVTSVPEGVLKDMRRVTLDERMQRKHQVRREKNEAIYGPVVEEPAPF
ncbi:HNH endonuclease signature motif containing protein [Corynebacterium ciconiae]|uniref:HNH endonuclease signature motif containing protein n=1 Tax=Corynebacterium ciconiae TaxID=227319 RepID=UPI0003750108|nr:HNH endonuclease signature motif containing protein [Corynebacterium ciconiae]